MVNLDDFNLVDDFIDICLSAGEAELIPEAKKAREAWGRILSAFGKEDIIRLINEIEFGLR
jgi:hypothetical protein